MEGEEVVEVAGEEVVGVKHRAGRAGPGMAEDAVAGELVGDAFDGDRRVEFHDATVGSDHPYHSGADVIIMGEAFEHAIPHFLIKLRLIVFVGINLLWGLDINVMMRSE